MNRIVALAMFVGLIGCGIWLSLEVRLIEPITTCDTILDVPILMPTVEELQTLCVRHGIDVTVDNKMGLQTLEAMERVRCNQEAEIAIEGMSK